MKKLLLIRHAKATHESGYSDHERPLTYSGMQDANTMAARLRMHQHLPQHIISSPALRTLSTANIFSEHLSLSAPETHKLIYEATADNLFDVVNDLPNQYDFIALVGHNPGISQVLHYFTGQIKDMPTCAVALTSFDTDEWKAISMDTGTLVYYDRP